MIDLNELEKYARDHCRQTFDDWDIDMQQDEFIDHIFGELGECLEVLPTEEKAQRSIKIIISQVYYYLYGVDKRALKKIKDKLRDGKKTIEKQVDNFIKILYDDFPSDTQGYDLLTILKDMKKNVWKYAKPPENIPVAEFTRENVKKTIIHSLSQRLDQRKCVNAVKRLLKKLPK